MKDISLAILSSVIFVLGVSLITYFVEKEHALQQLIRCTRQMQIGSFICEFESFNDGRVQYNITQEQRIIKSLLDSSLILLEALRNYSKDAFIERLKQDTKEIIKDCDSYINTLYNKFCLWKTGKMNEMIAENEAFANKVKKWLSYRIEIENLVSKNKERIDQNNG